MKKLLAALILFSAIAFNYNMKAPKADNAVMNTAQPVLTDKATTYFIDTAASTIGWIGSKPSGKHNGSIVFSKGEIEVKGKNIASGNFTVNMGTLANLDLSGKGKEGLEKHLRGADFFDVENHPTAYLAITKIEAAPKAGNLIMEDATHIISGNFTLKGITQNISFPANIVITGDMLNAKASFNIDRTLWGITYGADGKVAKEINLTLDIKASR